MKLVIWTTFLLSFYFILFSAFYKCQEDNVLLPQKAAIKHSQSPYDHLCCLQDSLLFSGSWGPPTHASHSMTHQDTVIKMNSTGNSSLTGTDPSLEFKLQHEHQC